MEGMHSQQRAKSGKVSKAFILLLRTHPQCLQVGNFGHFQTSKSTDRGSISKGPSGGAAELFTLEAELGYWWCPKQSNPNFRALKPQVPNNLSPGAAVEGAWDTQPILSMASFGVTLHPASSQAHRSPEPPLSLGQGPWHFTLQAPSLASCKEDLLEHLGAALLGSTGQWGLRVAYVITEAAFTEKERESYTQNANSKTLCPLLIQSRQDCDTAITHVCVPHKAGRVPLVSSKLEESSLLHRNWVHVLFPPWTKLVEVIKLQLSYFKS